jgi:DNA-binding PadR family transcriptional regulator
MPERAMSENVLLVLISLAGGPKDAHEVLDDIHRDVGSRGTWGLGQLAATLRRLHNLNLVDVACDGGHHLGRRSYKLTEAGRSRLLQEVTTLDRIIRAAHSRLAVFSGASTPAAGSWSPGSRSSSDRVTPGSW